MKIKCSIPFHEDWDEHSLTTRFAALCKAEPRLLAIARVIERHTSAGPGTWHTEYAPHVRRLCFPLTHGSWPIGRAFEVAEDYLLRLLIEHRAERTLRLPPVKTPLDKKAMQCSLPAPQAMDPYSHTIHVLSNV